MLTDRSLVWTGGLNDDVVLGGSVGLYDTTLRDGEQTVGVVLDPGPDHPPCPKLAVRLVSGH